MSSTTDKGVCDSVTWRHSKGWCTDLDWKINGNKRLLVWTSLQLEWPLGVVSEWQRGRPVSFEDDATDWPIGSGWEWSMPDGRGMCALGFSTRMVNLILQGWLFVQFLSLLSPLLSPLTQWTEFPCRVALCLSCLLTFPSHLAQGSLASRGPHYILESLSSDLMALKGLSRYCGP